MSSSTGNGKISRIFLSSHVCGIQIYSTVFPSMLASRGKKYPLQGEERGAIKDLPTLFLLQLRGKRRKEVRDPSTVFFLPLLPTRYTPALFHPLTPRFYSPLPDQMKFDVGVSRFSFLGGGGNNRRHRSLRFCCLSSYFLAGCSSSCPLKMTIHFGLRALFLTKVAGRTLKVAPKEFSNAGVFPTLLKSANQV